MYIVHTYIYLSHDVSISQILPSPFPPPLSLLSFSLLSLFPPPSHAPTIESVVAGECQEEARQHSELRPEEVLLQSLCHLVTCVCNRLERDRGAGREVGERGRGGTLSLLCTTVWRGGERGTLSVEFPVRLVVVVLTYTVLTLLVTLVRLLFTMH